jgi:LPS-assembly protein
VYLQGKRLARFSVDSKYRVSNGWEEANWDFEISPAEWLNVRESGNYNLSIGEVSFSNTYISAKAPFGLELWTNYYKQQNPEEITYLRWGTSFPINKYLSFSFQNRYDLRLNEDRERQYSLRVNRGCWNGILSYRWIKTYTNEINYQITLRINLLRLGSYGYQLTGTKVK